MIEKVSIIAIGNKSFGDDRISSIVLDRVRDKIKDAHYYDLETDIFNLIDLFISADGKFIVIDAIKGDILGKVHILDIDDLKRYGKYSLHGFSLFEAVQIAKSMKKELRLQIIGIEGKNFNFNDKISKELLDNIDKIRDEIVGIIKRCE